MTIKKNEDGSVTVTLSAPLTTATGEVNEITLKRPKAKQMRALDKGTGQVTSTLEMLQVMTGIPMPFLDELDGEDYVELAAAINGFLGKSPKTGDAA
jgi:hypothetical protein